MRRCVICGATSPDADWPVGWAVLFDEGWYCPDHHDTALLVASSIPATVIEADAVALAYPDHHPTTALANYRAGREVWDTNGDMW